jgi:hypothetical protein
MDYMWMNLPQPDANEVEMCDNDFRNLSKYVFDNNYVKYRGDAIQTNQ